MTSDDYAVVKLTAKSGQVMEDGGQILMKLAKETGRQAREARDRDKKRKKSSFSQDLFTEKEEGLFEKLRTLRLEIAREEKVPPYIVFSDKTLAHMCVVKPKTKEEMLGVSGVGEFKFEKYGERFLKCLL